MNQTNSETQKIKQLLIDSYDGEAWHGPSVKRILDTIDVGVAAQRLTGSHNIIEIVRHMVAWRHFVVARLQGNDAFDVTADNNWTRVTELQAFAWLEATEQLQQSQEQMIRLLDNMEDSKLDEIVFGRTYNYYTLLQGIIQHDLYHLGQIVLLNKPQLTVTMAGQTQPAG